MDKKLAELRAEVRRQESRERGIGLVNNSMAEERMGGWGDGRRVGSNRQNVSTSHF